MPKKVTRVAIVCDDDCTWYVRRVRHVVHNITRDGDEMAYHCREPIGGRYDTLDVAVRLVGMRAAIFAVG
jgi:hypothetical protein